MLTGWIAKLRLRSAARRYARSLGPRLRRDYGAGVHYTPGQIRTAAAKCKLPTAYLSIGFAAFLPEVAFRARRLQTISRDQSRLAP